MSFSIAGKTLKLDSAQDVEFLISELDQIPNLKEIKLSGNTLGVEAAKAIAGALKNKPELSVCSISS